MVDDADLAARLASLSLERKVRLLTGADVWSLHAEPAVGLRRLVVSDGPAGVRGELWDERETSANVPSPTALAATWDETLVGEVGRLLAAECRRKGVDVLLAPTVNLQRTPFGGRHFECFSEDPLLSARIGVAYVRGVQSEGVGATVKHFVANDSETERMTLDARIDERALRELYLAPFEAVVRDGGVWAVMAAYNAVGGEPMTESGLLRDVLQREWGFDGLVMSDWFATRSTLASARAGLDLVMPGPEGPWGDVLVAAVQAGEVDEATIDDKVVRILRLAARVGALDGCTPASVTPPDDAQAAATLRRAAAASFVLAHNDRDLLPLDRPTLTRVAVIGESAAAARTMGGGSATVFPPYVVSPLDGLRASLDGVADVEHCVGVLASQRVPVAGQPWVRRPEGGGPGVEVRFVGPDGGVVGREHRPGCAFTWLGAFGDGLAPADVARVEIHAVVRATEPGTYAIGVSGVGRYRLSVGGAVAFDALLEVAPGTDVVEAMVVPPQATHDTALQRGEEVAVVLEHEVGSGASGGGPGAAFQLNLRAPHASDDEEIERAVAMARDADIAVVVAGTTEEVESEGFDRTSLALPGRQDELVRRVAAENPNTVVVVNAGAPVLMPWADEVAAVLLGWFAGQEFGNALADVLLGVVEPGGRLPTTWPADEHGLPSTRPVDGVLSYDEGLFVGYRAPGRAARYVFGHGLGYTSWEFESITGPQSVAAGADVAIEVGVRNTGTRRGRHVVQLYASRAAGEPPRPPLWLAGFAVVEADAGAAATAVVTVRARALEHWDVRAGAWRVEHGAFDVAAGASSALLPLRTTITIEPAT